MQQELRAERGRAMAEYQKGVASVDQELAEPNVQRKRRLWCYQRLASLIWRHGEVRTLIRGSPRSFLCGAGDSVTAYWSNAKGTVN